MRPPNTETLTHAATGSCRQQCQPNRTVLSEQDNLDAAATITVKASHTTPLNITKRRPSGPLTSLSAKDNMALPAGSTSAAALAAEAASRRLNCATPPARLAGNDTLTRIMTRAWQRCGQQLLSAAVKTSPCPCHSHQSSHISRSSMGKITYQHPTAMCSQPPSSGSSYRSTWRAQLALHLQARQSALSMTRRAPDVTPGSCCC